MTTERNKRQRPAPDWVKRKFVAKDMNQLWAVDIGYVPTWEGFLYLAVVTDVYSRKVVGWAFGVQMTADLVIMALNMALHTRKLGPSFTLATKAASAPAWPLATDAWKWGYALHGYRGRCL